MESRRNAEIHECTHYQGKHDKREGEGQATAELLTSPYPKFSAHFGTGNDDTFIETLGSFRKYIQKHALVLILDRRREAGRKKDVAQTSRAWK